MFICEREKFSCAISNQLLSGEDQRNMMSAVGATTNTSAAIVLGGSNQIFTVSGNAVGDNDTQRRRFKVRKKIVKIKCSLHFSKNKKKNASEKKMCK